MPTASVFAENGSSCSTEAITDSMGSADVSYGYMGACGAAPRARPVMCSLHPWQLLIASLQQGLQLGITNWRGGDTWGAPEVPAVGSAPVLPQ